MKRTDWARERCPIARTVASIGEWGSLMILREVFGGVTRFDDFQSRLGMSRNLLTSRLKKLVEAGVLERRPIAEDAKRLEYVLTPMGRDLFPMIVAIRQWGDRWLFEAGDAPAEMVAVGDGTRVAALEVRSKGGRPLTLADIRLVPRRRRISSKKS